MPILPPRELPSSLAVGTATAVVAAAAAAALLPSLSTTPTHSHRLYTGRLHTTPPPCCTRHAPLRRPLTLQAHGSSNSSSGGGGGGAQPAPTSPLTPETTALVPPPNHWHLQRQERARLAAGASVFDQLLDAADAADLAADSNPEGAVDSDHGGASAAAAAAAAAGDAAAGDASETAAAASGRGFGKQQGSKGRSSKNAKLWKGCPCGSGQPYKVRCFFVTVDGGVVDGGGVYGSGMLALRVSSAGIYLCLITASHTHLQPTTFPTPSNTSHPPKHPTRNPPTPTVVLPAVPHRRSRPPGGPRSSAGPRLGAVPRNNLLPR